MTCDVQSSLITDTPVSPSCPVCAYPHRRMVEYLLETGAMSINQIANFYFELSPDDIQNHHDNCDFEGAI